MVIYVEVITRNILVAFSPPNYSSIAYFLGIVTFSISISKQLVIYWVA